MRLMAGFSRMDLLLEVTVNSGSVYGFAREVHSRAEHIVASEIWCNDSILVSALINGSYDDQFEFERIENLFDGSIDAMEEFLVEEGKLPADWDRLSSEVMIRIATQHRFSPLLQDICEWWRVSKSLARHLHRIGVPVLRNDYGCWWGRTCSGQDILMDGVIQQTLDPNSGRFA